MKKLSERGLATIIFMIVLILGVVLVTVLENIQEVQSKEWQEHLGIDIEYSEVIE